MKFAGSNSEKTVNLFWAENVQAPLTLLMKRIQPNGNSFFSDTNVYEDNVKLVERYYNGVIVAIHHVVSKADEYEDRDYIEDNLKAVKKRVEGDLELINTKVGIFCDDIFHLVDLVDAFKKGKYTYMERNIKIKEKSTGFSLCEKDGAIALKERAIISVKEPCDMDTDTVMKEPKPCVNPFRFPASSEAMLLAKSSCIAYRP